MRLALVLVVLAGMAATAAAKMPPLPEDLPGILAELRDRNSVSGHSGGGYPSPEPSRFWQLLDRGAEVAKPEELERLLSDDHPVVRAFALSVLVRARGEKAVPSLLRCLGDSGPFFYSPFGCITIRGTVGRLAYDLLEDRLVLDEHPEERPVPLLPPERRIALDLDLLSRDDAVTVRGRIRERWLGDEDDWEWYHTDRPRPPLRFPELRKAGGGLPDWRLVKAVGRLGPHPDVRAFLTGVLRDGALDRDARFAAASALTRDLDDRSEAALEEVGSRLPASDPLRAVVAACREERETVRQAGSAPLESSHAAAAPLLDRRLFRGELGEQRDAAVAALARIAAKLMPREPWDTWRDGSDEVRLVVRGLRIAEFDAPALTADEAKAILDAIPEALRPR
jgi:hypothetical protein